jgi:hypothetical protein
MTPIIVIIRSVFYGVAPTLSMLVEMKHPAEGSFEFYTITGNRILWWIGVESYSFVHVAEKVSQSSAGSLDPDDYASELDVKSSRLIFSTKRWPWKRTLFQPSHRLQSSS